MRVLVFGGTAEGRALTAGLRDLGARVTVSVATGYGLEALAGLEGIEAVAGRKTAAEMAALLPGFSLCVDATHPYAVEATENIKAACKQTGVPYLRCLREESPCEGCLQAESAEEAAALLEKLPGNVLLTTGAKELPAFSALDPHRLFARVLPTQEALAACQEAGLPKSHIIAMQGPFSQKLNEALMEQLGIAVLVTKDGGAAGGFPQKRAAAGALGVKLVVIGRPRETGASPQEILQIVKERIAW